MLEEEAAVRQFDIRGDGSSSKDDGILARHPPLGHEEGPKPICVVSQLSTCEPEDGTPDGGPEAWVCVSCSFLILFIVWGFATGLGQLQAYYSSHQLRSYTESQVSWIASVHSFLTYAGSLLAGRFFDSHGLRLLIRTGSSMIVASLLALAFCQEYYQIMLSHVLYGLGATLLYTPSLAVMGHWFKRRRSTAVGLVICGNGLGGIVYPLLFRELLARLSFRDSVLIAAGLNATLLAPCWFFMKTRLPIRQPSPWRKVFGALRETRYLYFLIGVSLIMINIFTPYFFAPYLAVYNNLNPDLGSYIVILLQAGSFAGRIACGFLADRFGVWRIFTLSGMLSGVFIMSLWMPQTGPVGAIFAVILFGITSGSWLTLVSASCGNISVAEEFGSRLGLLWTIASFPILAGPPVSGVDEPVFLRLDDGKFVLTGAFCGITYIVGSFVVIIPRLRLRTAS